MTNSKPLILITNDDGFNSPGIEYLIRCIAKSDAEIIVVAPDGPRSGQASAISVNVPLFIKEECSIDGAKIFRVNGTPVDCVKLAMHTVLPRRPDIVLSGINHGSNAGNCVIYSGTMGAVIEACMLGIPAIGFSLLHHSWEADFSKCGAIIDKITSAVMSRGLPEGICLNVNIPARCTPEGIKVTRAARGYWTEEYVEYKTPGGAPFYWLTGRFVNEEPDAADTDEYWLAQQYATVVPVRPDQSATDCIGKVRSILSD